MTLRFRKRYRTAYVLTDRGYQALAEYTDGDHIRIGPVPCQGCHRPVEWRGPLGWCDSGLQTTHRCHAG